MSKENYFFWVDLETTGLDPRRCDVLELAAVITDFDLKKLGTYERVYYHDKNELRGVESGSISKHVLDMHTENGLWDDCAAAPTGPCWRRDRQSEIIDFIHIHCGDVKPVPAGSSIHFDMGFIQENMKALCGHLHYRRFDCRTLQTALEGWGGCPKFPKKGAHRAMPDILETLDYARKIKKILGGMDRSRFGSFQ